jgi:hypothetical protein
LPTSKAILGQPYDGFLSFVSITSLIKSLEGPFGPGFERPFFEKSREYFLLTNALEPKKAALLRLSKIGADEMFGILLAQIFGGRVVAKADSTSGRL